MRKYFLVLTLLLPSLTFAQIFDEKKHEISEIIETSLSAKELFVNARKTLATVFSNFQKELDDDLGYNIIAYGVMNIPMGNNSFNHTDIQSFRNNTIVNFRLSIACKDNKYRYIISDITLRQNKEFIKTKQTDFVTSFFFNYSNSQTTYERSKDSYSYFDMDSIYHRDSIAYFSTMGEFNRLMREKDTAKRKERERIYKSMSYVGRIAIDNEKIYNSTKLFHSICKSYMQVLILNIKKGMVENNEW